MTARSRRLTFRRVAAVAVAKLAALVLLATVAAPELAAQRGDRTPPLFATHDVLELTLTTDLPTLLGDKMDGAPWRPARIAITDSAGAPLDLPVRVRTRGRWRLEHCQFPPLRLNFVKDSVRRTTFATQDRPKLATHCRPNREYEQYLLHEYLLYRTYALVTPMSFRARLARVTYVDATGGAQPRTHWGVLLEDPDALAERLEGELFEAGVIQENLDPDAAVVMGLFQFLIGNTDWSAPGPHNIETIRLDSTRFVAVPYDFDWSGAVNARYAKPNPILGTSSVRTRVWRGVCPRGASLRSAIALFNERRPAITALYEGFEPLEEDARRRVLRYFDEFYEIINDPQEVDRQIVQRCAGATG